MRAGPSSEPFRPGVPGLSRPARSLTRFAGLVAGLIFLGWSLRFLSIPLDRLPGVLGRMLAVLGQRYFPPQMSQVTSGRYLQAVLDTLQMSFVASALGLLLAMPLAWMASFNVSPSRRLGYPLARLVITGCRSVHEMIWTILLVAVVGFGMLSGTLALTFLCVGFAGKLFAEAMEAVQKGPVEAIRATGARELQVLFYGILPQVRVAWAGIAIYTWDVVFRAATVIGFFGAGGMGSYLRESVQRIESQQVTAIVLSIVAVVAAAEVVSAWARERVARAVA